jgi:hypothetical protein
MAKDREAVNRQALADRFYNAALELDRQGKDEEMVTAYLEVTMQLMLDAVKVEPKAS